MISKLGIDGGTWLYVGRVGVGTDVVGASVPGIRVDEHDVVEAGSCCCNSHYAR